MCEWFVATNILAKGDKPSNAPPTKSVFVVAVVVVVLVSNNEQRTKIIFHAFRLRRKYSQGLLRYWTWMTSLVRYMYDYRETTSPCNSGPSAPCLVLSSERFQILHVFDPGFTWFYIRTLSSFWSWFHEEKLTRLHSKKAAFKSECRQRRAFNQRQ